MAVKKNPVLMQIILKCYILQCCMYNCMSLADSISPKHYILNIIMQLLFCIHHAKAPILHEYETHLK